jgi:hypothetical protein
MSGAIPQLPNTPSWHGAQLKDMILFVMVLWVFELPFRIIRIPVSVL